MSFITYTPYGGSSDRYHTITGARNAILGETAAQDLTDGSTGIRFNLMPHRVPFDCKLDRIELSSRTQNSFNLALLINGTSRATFTKPANVNTHTVELTTVLNNIEINEGDEIRIRFTGSTGNCNRPTIQIILKEQ